MSTSNTSPNNMPNTWRCSEERVVQYRDVEDGNGTTTVGYRVLSLRRGHQAGQTPMNEQGAAQEQGQKKKTAILVFHAMGADSNVIEFFAPFQENSSAPGTTMKGLSTKQEDNSNFAAALSAGSGLGCPDGVLTNAHTSASKKPSNELVVIAVDRPGLGKTSPEVVNNPTFSADDTVKRHLNLHARNCLAVLQQEALDEMFVYACCLGHPYAVVFLRRFLQLQLSHESHQKQLPDLRGVALNVPYPSPAGPHGFGLARFASKYVPTSVLSGVACVGQGLCKPLVQFSFGNSSAKMLRTALSSEEKEMFIASVGSVSSGSCVANKYDFEQNGRVLDAMGVEGGKDTAKGLEVSTSLVWQDDCVLLAKELKGLADAFRQEGEEKKGKTSFFTVFGSSEKDRLTPAKAVRWLVTDVYAELECDYEATAPCSSHELMLMGGGPVWKAPLHEKLLREKWALI